MSYDFIITGAGIAGLTTAIALQRLGFQVKIFERSKQLREVGAGLGLGANAWKALERLSITSDLQAKCNLIESTNFLDPKGKLISKVDFERLNKKYGVAYFTIHRADLQKTLAHHLQSGTLELGQQVVDVDQNESGVIVKLAGGREVQGRALIAADGIHSIVRKICLPHIKPRYAGYTCWRGIVKVPNDMYSPGEFTETWGAKGRFGIVPLTQNQMYWYACVNAPYRSETFSQFTVQDLLRQFKDYHFPISEWIQRTKDEDVIWNDIIDLDPLDRYVHGNILLIGDAAHATTPNIGQGAGQAIEDAVVLGEVFKNQPNVEEAFKQFEQRRIPKASKVIRMSWCIGKLAQIDNPYFIRIRNALMRILPSSIPEKQLESVFKTDW